MIKNASEMNTIAQQLLVQGFPSTAQEAWKYTDMRGLAKRSWQWALFQSEIAPELIEEVRCSEWVLVIINGYWSVLHSHLPPEIQVQPLSVTTALPAEGDIFAQLNHYCAQQPVQIHVAPNFHLKSPLQIIHVATQAAWILPRIEMTVAANSQLTIYETFIGNSAAVTNAHLQLHLAAQAQVDYIKWQRESAETYHIGRTFITLDHHARVRTHHYATGALLARSEIHVLLQGKESAAELYGFYLGRHRQHLDQQTFVDHAVPYTQSTEHYRGILFDNARAVFNGKILVRPQADHTEAAQENHHLLLSSEAEVDTKPELEIYHNEVKCMHGATIGQLDKNAQFYLQARGLPVAQARQLLLSAFMEKTLEKLPEKGIAQALRQWLEENMHVR